MPHSPFTVNSQTTSVLTKAAYAQVHRHPFKSCCRFTATLMAWALLYTPSFAASLQPIELSSPLSDHLAADQTEQISDFIPDQLQQQRPFHSLNRLHSLKNSAVQHSDLKHLASLPYVQTLNNSQQMRSLFVASHDLPMFDLQLTFHAGSAHDQSQLSGLFGLANMAAKLLPEGTAQYNSKQLAQQFDTLAAQYSVSSFRDMFIVRLRMLSQPEKLNAAVNLVLHNIQHANFQDSGINLILNNTQIGQKQVQENPSRLMNIQFYRSLYSTHPYAQPSVGTQASIRKIKPAQLQQFRDQFLVAQNCNLAITGDLTTAEALALTEKISHALPQGHAAAAIPVPIEQQDFQIHWLKHPTQQAHVMLGHLGIRRNDPDRVALEVANRIFGGNGLNSRLAQELRLKRGYSYGVHSSLNSTEAEGVFQFNYATEQSQLMDSLRLAHQTLIDFIHKPIDPIALNEAKLGMLRALPMSLSSNANINAQLASLGFYGLEAYYLNQYQKQIQQLTAQQLQAAIQRHLHADRLTVVIVADDLDIDALKQQLQSAIQKETYPYESI